MKQIKLWLKEVEGQVLVKTEFLRELAKIAFVNPGDVINFDEATVKSDAKEDDLAAIASVKIKNIPTEDGEITEREIKLCDKLKALDLLGKHLGIYDKHEAKDRNLTITINKASEKNGN